MGKVLSREAIQATYEALGFDKGWTFLACREERLDDARVAIIGLNPGGGSEADEWVYGPVWSCANNSFTNDPSEHQAQVRAWHDMLALEYEQTLCAQFIPFRSPDMARLLNATKAVAFANDLWRAVLNRSPATLFLTMGGTVANNLTALLEATPIEPPLPTGWGRTNIKVWRSPCNRRVVQMPHPSRYKLFGRGAASQLAVQSFLTATRDAV